MNELQATQTKQLINNDFSSEKIALIKNTVAKDATDIELQFFVEQCKRTGLDPITRQIYFIKDKNGKVNIQTSIDGLRLIASRSGEYEGQSTPMWCGEDGQWKDVWLSPTPPSACKIGVYKKGFREALSAVAIFNEYNAKNYIWNNKPALMLAKVAEALALRKSFPNEMSGIYSQDEYDPELKEESKQVTSVVHIKPAQVIAEQNKQAQAINEPVGAIHADTYEHPEYETNAPLIQTSAKSGPMYADYVIPIGKDLKGKTLKDVDPARLESFANWLIKDSREKGKPLSGNAADLVQNVTAYLGSLNN